MAQQNKEPEMNDQLRVRREKMADLREQGIDPFGQRFERTDLARDLHEKYDQDEKDTLLESIPTATIAGRMMTKRGKGKVALPISVTVLDGFKFTLEKMRLVRRTTRFSKKS